MAVIREGHGSAAAVVPCVPSRQLTESGNS
jgi:hypothetical protein